MKLKEEFRESIINRMRPLLILDLIDYLNGYGLFSKIVAKEIFNLEEGIVKAFAESNGVSIYDNNNNVKPWKQLLKEIQNATNIDANTRQKIIKIVNNFSSIKVPIRTRTASYIPLRDFLRNQETHYLSHPSFTVARSDVRKLMSLLFELLETVDDEIIKYFRSTPDVNGQKFWNLYCFYKKFIINNNTEENLKLKEKLRELKTENIWLPVKTVSKIPKNGRQALVGVEIGVWELIRKIEEESWE